MYASDTFLQINDQINTVINRYEAFQKGDYVTSSNPIPAELGGGPGALSLIDLDDGAPSGGGSGGMDDLAGLFVSSTNGHGATVVVSPQPGAPQQEFGSIMLRGTPTPQAQLLAQGQRAAGQEQGKDPFADLVDLF
jgi:hypothetical protein